MDKVTIGFIGGGNMASSLIGGLLADNYPADRIWVAETRDDARNQLAERFAIRTSADAAEVAGQCDVVVLAVKPQSLAEVCHSIRDQAQARKPLLLSVAAGVTLTDIERWLGGEMMLVRTMPNTPALLQAGATALCANARVSAEQREQAEAIMRAVGIALWVDDEAQMDAVTAISGSGPAYFFLLMELLESAGQKLGLDADTSRLLVLQTAFGAARMALESDADPATLRARVTSPGGTTERAINTFLDGDLAGLVERAVSGARERAEELARELGAAE